MTNPDRRLAGHEIDLLVHILKSGGALTPIRVLSTAMRTALELRRLGLVNSWIRQSVAQGRPDGPFFTLTRPGTFRAEALLLSRQRHQASTICQSRASSIEPPHNDGEQS